VRIAAVFIAIPASAASEKKDALKKKAEAALAEAQALRKTGQGWGELIKKYSDKNSHYSGGDSVYFDREGKPAGMDQKIVQAAFSLERVGNMPEQVIEAADGYHIIMLTSRRAAVNNPLEKMREQLKQRVRRERVAGARQAFLDDLKAKTAIKINDKKLIALAAALNKNAQVPVAPKRQHAGPPMPGK
jgi:peptidyl-prolyl cis-trans isomerase C